MQNPKADLLCREPVEDQEMFGFGRDKGAIVIEKFGNEDLSAVSEIHSASFAKGWSDGEISRLIANENYLSLVARRMGKTGERPLGFLLIRSVIDEAEIITIAVDPSARGRGVARQLMDEGIRRLQADRVKSVFLEVDEHNDSAVGLYRKIGFFQVSDRKGYYTNSKDDQKVTSSALVMKRELG